MAVPFLTDYICQFASNNGGKLCQNKALLHFTAGDALILLLFTQRIYSPVEKLFLKPKRKDEITQFFSRESLFLNMLWNFKLKKPACILLLESAGYCPLLTRNPCSFISSVLIFHDAFDWRNNDNNFRSIL